MYVNVTRIVCGDVPEKMSSIARKMKKRAPSHAFRFLYMRKYSNDAPLMQIMRNRSLVLKKKLKKDIKINDILRSVCRQDGDGAKRCVTNKSCVNKPTKYLSANLTLQGKNMLFAGWGVRIVKNCYLALENAVPGLRSRTAFSRPRGYSFSLYGPPSILY